MVSQCSAFVMVFAYERGHACRSMACRVTFQVLGFSWGCGFSRLDHVVRGEGIHMLGEVMEIPGLPLSVLRYSILIIQ